MAEEELCDMTEKRTYVQMKDLALDRKHGIKNQEKACHEPARNSRRQEGDDDQYKLIHSIIYSSLTRQWPEVHMCQKYRLHPL